VANHAIFSVYAQNWQQNVDYTQASLCLLWKFLTKRAEDIIFSAYQNITITIQDYIVNMTLSINLVLPINTANAIKISPLTIANFSRL